MSRFLIQFLTFLAVLAALLLGLRTAYGAAVVHPLAGYLLGYLAALTLATYWVTARLVAISPDNFILAYLGGTVLRLLLSLGIVMGYLLRGGAHAGRGLYTFLGAFFTLYFLWAGFEIWAVVSNLRPISKKQVPVK